MSSIGPTGAGGYIPPEPNKIEGKKGEVRSQPQNTLQAEICQAQALLQNGDQTGAIQEIDTILTQLGPGTLPNAARNELLAAKSAIIGGAAASAVNVHLNAAFNFLGPQLGGQQNSYQVLLHQIMSDLSNGGDSSFAIIEIAALKAQVRNSGGSLEDIQQIEDQLEAAISGLKGNAPLSSIMSNLNEANTLLANL